MAAPASRRAGRMRIARRIFLILGMVLATASSAQAHRPYFTQVEPIILPDGQPGEMRILRGDGIIFADPARILVLDRDGRLLARSGWSSSLVLICDPARRSCRGYDGVMVLGLDPASFRHGPNVPGLGDKDRDDLWVVEQGGESWGFAAEWLAIPDRVRGEILLARETGRELALLVPIGAAAAILAVVGLWRPRAGSRFSSALWAIRGLLCLVGLGIVLPIGPLLVWFAGVSITGSLASFGVGVAIVLLLRWFIRSRLAAPAPIA